MTVLTPLNAFPGIPAPQHGSGQSIVQNYLYPGAVQVLSNAPVVLSWTNAFPAIPVPNHLSGQSHPQDYLYPGALQPTIPSLPATPWSLPTILHNTITAALIASQVISFVPVVTTPSPVTEAHWHQPWSDPVRAPLRDTWFQPATALVSFAPFPESVSEDRWHQAWLEPIRRPWTPDTHQFHAGNIFPLPNLTPQDFGQFPGPTWRRGLPTEVQQSWTGPQLPVIPALSWYSAFGDPVRIPSRLLDADQQAFAFGSIFPILTPLTWYEIFGEPVRSKPKLGESLQQSLIWSPQTLVFPTLPFTWSSTETGDVGSFSLVDYSKIRKVYANVSILEIKPIYANLSSWRRQIK